MAGRNEKLDRSKPVRGVNSAAALPLSALLSQALVAFTIEFDNEAERQMQHRTTRHGLAKHVSAEGSLHAPWLVSLVMWSNCMQFLGEDRVTVAELELLARTKTNLNGMERWGYVTVEADPADMRPKPPGSAWVIRATAAGRKAQEIWRPLFGAIEKRWRERFDDDEIARLREVLWALIERTGLDLPDCLPILGYGLFSQGPAPKRASAGRSASRGGDAGPHLPLSALLSRVLLAFALEFEREAALSLAVSANVVRVLDDKGVRVRDLPRLTGVSKEAIAISLGSLEKGRYIVIEPDPAAARTKRVRLTAKGRAAQEKYGELLGVIENSWRDRFGKETISALRASLERLVGEPTAELSPLFRGLEPYPNGWRASVPKPSTLPHFPMVLHRGGFPDGS
jgi:DNA-binding MarR family transcriptional regulator